MAPKIYYFPFRGRAETLRIALAYAGVDFEFEATGDPAELKNDLGAYHFGQVPRYVDDEVDMCQSHAIVRHIGRKHGLYGNSLAQQARVDEIIEGGNDLAQQLFVKYLMSKDEGAKEQYWQDHVNPETVTIREAFGAHAGFLAKLLEANPDSCDWFAGNSMTIGDIHAAVIVEMHLTAFGDEFRQAWPTLAALYDRVMSQPKVAAYRASADCFPSLVPGMLEGIPPVGGGKTTTKA